MAVTGCTNKAQEEEAQRQQAIADATREELTEAVADRDQLLTLMNEVRSLLACNHYNNLTLGLVHGKESGKLVECAAMDCLVHLGYLTRHRRGPGASARLGEFGKSSCGAQG